MEEIPRFPDCFIIHDVLSPEECQRLIASLTFPETIDTRLYGGDREIDQQRIVDRLKEKNTEMADVLFRRISPMLPVTYTLEEDDPEFGFFSKGAWDLVGLNDMISCYRYTPGGKFSIHRDGIYQKNEDCRSFFTILIYLNSTYTGGRTTIYSDDMTYSVEVEPAPGLAFVMLQRMLHEGKCVETGEKYALRLDVMYQRQGEYDASRLDRNRLAEEYVTLAVEFERAKNISKSIEYYKKAFKLNPDLELLL